MAIVEQPTLDIAAAGALMLTPPMTAGLLDRALRNGNHVWRYHVPPLVNAVPMDQTSGRNRIFLAFVRPSADGLAYTFEHRYWASAGTITVKVESNTGTDPTAGWSTVYGTTATASLAEGWHTHTHTATIGATVTMLRITYAAGTAATYLASHILGYPAPGAVPSGIQAGSGFIGYNDALLALPGAPINTEMANRCRQNPLRILRDRWQCVASLMQPYVAGAPWNYGGYSAPNTAAPGPMLLGRAVASLPGQASATLRVGAIGEVSAGAGTVTLSTPTAAVSLPLSGLLETADLYLPGIVPGGVPFDVTVTAPDGETAHLHSIVALWQPGA